MIHFAELNFKHSKILIFQSVLMLLYGCSSAELSKTPPPALKTPEAWQAGVGQESWNQEPWFKAMQDEALAVLVEEALKHNFDVKLSAARVELAQARAKSAGVAGLPEVSASLGSSLKNSFSGTERTNTAGFTGGLSVSWEADLWDRMGNRARAAALDYEASVLDLKAARFSLAALIAKSWYNAIEANLQYQLVQRRVTNLQKNLEIVEDGFRHNEHSALDVLLARSNLFSEQSRLAQAQRTRDTTLQSLEILLGRYPAKRLSVAERLPEVRSSIPAGLPSELLQRRPDLLALERQLAAADERVAEAWKNRYPSLRLTGSLGVSSEELSELLSSESLIASLAGSLTIPLLEGEKLEAEEAQARANTQLIAAEYGQTMLRAFYEVEAALTAESLLAAQEKLLTQSSQDAQAGETLAFEQYQGGLVTFVTVLDAQRRAFEAENRLIEVRNLRLQNRITLYLALGGDF